MMMNLQEALDLWQYGHQPTDTSKLPTDIQARLETAPEHARAAVARVTSEDANRALPLLANAAASSTSGKRVFWLHKAAQSLADTYGTHSACRPGCSHCCHIPVKITQAEAIYIGRQIGRRPRAAKHLGPPPSIVGYESPCPFLASDSCSIYEWRPMVCRSHLNFDQDDLLCRLLPGMSVPVPYLDTRLLVLAAIDILGQTQPIADIRQWFGDVGSEQHDRPSTGRTSLHKQLRGNE
ncbi:MAG: YkgJ family cysteine cluster protein [Hydrogenophaga sp.]|nr:YkgJ family cysteine cluster protein [Hydrogenophaga sp.]